MADPVSERYKEALRQGHVAVVRGRPRDALAHYEEAGRLAGHRALPFVSMGSVLLGMGRPQESIVAFDEALRRAPDDPAALRGKGQALDATGRRVEAAAIAQRLAFMEGVPHMGPAPRGGAQNRPAAAELRFAAAETAQAAGNVPAAVEAYVIAAHEYLAANALDAALDACERALELAPGSPSVHLAMATNYLRRAWRGLAAERLALLDHLASLCERADERAAILSMLREHRARHPEMGDRPADRPGMAPVGRPAPAAPAGGAPGLPHGSSVQAPGGGSSPVPGVPPRAAGPLQAGPLPPGSVRWPAGPPGRS